MLRAIVCALAIVNTLQLSHLRRQHDSVKIDPVGNALLGKGSAQQPSSEQAKV